MLAPLLVLACLAPQKTKAFASRSGEMQLEVERVKQAETVAYTWTLRGPVGELWRKPGSHSVNDAFVCADGTVVAYGLIDRQAPEWKDKTPLTILGPDGAVRLLESLRIQSRVCNGGCRAYPRARAVLVWEKLDACAFWIEHSAKPDSVWTFTLSSGERTGQFEPELALASAASRDPSRLRLRSTLAPGGNELLLTTYTDGSRGLVALFSANGELLWFDEAPPSLFFGSVDGITSSADGLRCTIGLERVEKDPDEPGPGRPVRGGSRDLDFRRDSAGAWRRR